MISFHIRAEYAVEQVAEMLRNNGIIAFYVMDPGEHNICFHCSSDVHKEILKFVYDNDIIWPEYCESARSECPYYDKTCAKEISICEAFNCEYSEYAMQQKFVF